MRRAHVLALVARDCVARSSRGLATLALVAAVLLAGCPGSTGDVGTVTPAPVPSQPPPMTDAPPSQSCGVATPAELADSKTPRPPATPVAIPVENGTVNESALLAGHDRALTQQSYRITAPGHSVVAAPNGSAYLVDEGESVRPVEHYVVGDRRFTYVRRDGGRNLYTVYPYDGGTFPDAGGDRISLTGRTWLADALSVAPHRVTTRRADGWTVLTAARGNVTDAVSGDVGTSGEKAGTDGDGNVDDGSVDDGNVDDGSVDDGSTSGDGNLDGDGAVRDGSGDDGRALRALNSTVLVDPHGVVRSVDQRLVVEEDGVYRMATRQFAVTDVGVAPLRQPGWVCEAVRAAGTTEG